MEWLDPVYCSGHWVPGMVDIAGGVDKLRRKGTDSDRVSSNDVLEWAPEVLIVIPCGFNLDKVVVQTPYKRDSVIRGTVHPLPKLILASPGSTLNTLRFDL